MGDHHSHVTTNHDKIRRWIEERDGVPATVERTGERRGEPGILRVKFPEQTESGSLKQLSWDDFFEKFDQENLAFLYQDEVQDGSVSRFCKFIDRSGAQTEHA